MTAQISPVNFRGFGKYFRYKLYSMRGYGIAQMIFGLLAYPFVSFAGLLALNARAAAAKAYEAYHALSQGMGGFIDSSEYLEWIQLQEKSNNLIAFARIAIFVCIAALAAIAIMHFFTQVKAFRWLYDKNAVDMDYSLPISDDARFWGDFTAGALLTGVPHLLSIVIGSIILQFARGLMEIQNIRAIIAGMIIGAAACALFYCFNMLVISFLGRAKEMVAITILLNIALPAVFFVGTTLMLYLTYGYENWLIGYVGFASADFTPLGLVLDFISNTGTVARNYSLSEDFSIGMVFTPKLVMTVAVAVIMYTAAAWAVVRSRRAEMVGKPYAFAPARLAVQLVIMIQLGLDIALCWMMGVARSDVFSKQIELTIYGIVIFSIVIFAATEVSSAKVKTLWISALKYLGCAAVSAIVAVVLVNANGFGIATRLPSEKNMDYVGITLDLNSESYAVSVEFTEDETKKLGREIFEELDTTRPYSTVTEGIRDGYIGNRIRMWDDNDYVTIAYCKDESYPYVCRFPIKEGRMENILRKLSVPEIAVKQAEDELMLDWEKKSYDEIEIVNLYDENNAVTNVSGSGLTIAKLMDAVKLDSKNITYENFFTTVPGVYKRTIKVEYVSDRLGTRTVTWVLSVYEWNENVISLLKQYGFDASPAPVKSEEMVLFKIDSSIDPKLNSYYRSIPSSLVDGYELYALLGEVEQVGRLLKEIDGLREQYNGLTAEEVIARVLEKFDAIGVSAKRVEPGSEAEEQLFALGSNIYALEQDYTQDSYVLAAVNPDNNEYIPATLTLSTYFPADSIDRVAEIYNNLN